MAIVCPSCGKENRDQARFCRGCARPLDRPGGDAGSDAVARERASRALRRARRRKRSGQRTEQQPAWWRWAGAMTAGVLVLAIGWWLGAHQSTPAPVQAAPLAGAPVASPSATPTAGTAAPATAPQTATEPVGADAASPNTPEAAAAVDRLRHSVELLEQQDRERAAAQAAQRQKLAQEQKRQEDARRRAEATSAAAPSAHATAPETPAVATSAPAAPAPVAAAAAAPSATRPAAGVDQLCAGSDNVFARDFCRIRECGKAVFANDPICVRFRQMDEARRREAEYR
ncbi:zinc ribbon domain-containing protein [Hydrogenophaga pseudoflava]|uniref:zinc ribbon domain-containing protein n=1 Tax=Hydrogenophaga pseudoflava TaxID=47421 RepID=UPI0012FB007A|nr:zinc ribbon domain-containing protein [Hydrogenophaga pseudoflava]